MLTCPYCQNENRPNAVHCMNCGKELRDPQSRSLLPGALLQNRYRIVRVVGMGGMGMVYEAQDQSLGEKRCAVKALNTGNIPPAELPDIVASFRREAIMLAQLDHPSLPRVTDRFDERNEYYLVMEYVEGDRLEDVIEDRGRVPFPVEQVALWAMSLCDVLDYLHSRNPPIIFRDLKPGNLIVTSQKKLKLIDFGIARFYDPAKTKDTVAMGTPGYSAPEQHGRGTTARSDLYSLAVIMHELLTGHDPCSTPFQLPAARELNPAVPPALEAVIVKATRLEPADRFANAREMKAAIRGALRPVSVKTERASPYFSASVADQAASLPNAVPPSPSIPYGPPAYQATAAPPARRSRWPWWLIVLLLLLALGVPACCCAAYALFSSSSQSPAGLLLDPSGFAQLMRFIL